MTPNLPIHPFLLRILQGKALDYPPVNPQEQEWNSILAAAEEHGLTGPLYGWLITAPSSHQPPAPCVTRAKTAAMRTAAETLRLTHELAGILLDANRRNLACMPIRGPALAEQLYGDCARPMSDLDLLVRRESLPAVTALLETHGYKEIDRRPGFSRTYSYTLEFVKEESGIIVEPHWTIAYPPFADRVDMEAVWHRSIPASVAGVPTRVLGPSDLFLHLAFHLAHKGPEAPLLWLYELDRVVRQNLASLDWPLIWRLAEDTGQAALLEALLLQVRETFDTPMPAAAPPAVSRSLRTAGPAGRLHRRLTPLLLGESSVDGRESLAHLLTLRGWRAKLHYAMGILFPSPAFMRRHYGLSRDAWLGFHYLARLLYFSREGCRGLWLLLVPRPDHR